MSTNTESERRTAYEAYCQKVAIDNQRHGTNCHPHPYENFQWEDCAICRQEIRDDPYGHNPAPVKNDGVCCSNCNRLVIFQRLRGVVGVDKAFEIAHAH